MINDDIDDNDDDNYNGDDNDDDNDDDHDDDFLFFPTLLFSAKPRMHHLDVSQVHHDRSAATLTHKHRYCIPRVDNLSSFSHRHLIQIYVDSSTMTAPEFPCFS